MNNQIQFYFQIEKNYSLPKGGNGKCSKHKHQSDAKALFS